MRAVKIHAERQALGHRQVVDGSQMKEDGRFGARGRQISGRHSQVGFSNISTQELKSERGRPVCAAMFSISALGAFSKGRLHEQQKTLAVACQPPQQTARDESGKPRQENCLFV